MSVADSDMRDVLASLYMNRSKLLDIIAQRESELRRIKAELHAIAQAAEDDCEYEQAEVLREIAGYSDA